ncbi:protein of unknown function [Tenacibaculum sp. 190130A14a]|uniref:TonB C-terminal domain-containing protein n=1 Tax=Tenacibaculum polynesiense TaxID=3137857 RepID=A0ABP1EZ42_9FLAO
MKHVIFAVLVMLSSLGFSQEEEIDRKKEFEKVQEVPIFPGCESEQGKEKRTKCFNAEMTKLVFKYFRTRKALNSNLPPGRVRMILSFKIDKEGHLKDIKTEAPTKKLKKELKRLASKVPELKPGKIEGEPVIVGYSIPIIFTVSN